MLIHLKALTSRKTETDSLSKVLLHFAKRKTNTYLLGYETILKGIDSISTGAVFTSSGKKEKKYSFPSFTFSKQKNSKQSDKYHQTLPDAY